MPEAVEFDGLKSFNQVTTQLEDVFLLPIYAVWRNFKGVEKVDIEDFVATSLHQIMGGVQKASERIRSDGCDGLICPSIRLDSVVGQNAYAVSGEGRPVQLVEFDLVVTVSEEAGAKANGGLKVLGMIDLGGGANFKDSEGHKSRVKFAIPVAMPNYNS